MILILLPISLWEVHIALGDLIYHQNAILYYTFKLECIHTAQKTAECKFKHYVCKPKRVEFLR